MRLFAQQEQLQEMGSWACQKPEGVHIDGEGERISRERRETCKQGMVHGNYALGTTGLSLLLLQLPLL